MALPVLGRHQLEQRHRDRYDVGRFDDDGGLYMYHKVDHLILGVHGKDDS